MTTGQKWLSLLLLQAGLLGAAYGGGFYPEWKKRIAAEETARKAREKIETDARQALFLTRARAVLMEAALAVRYGNYGMAFDRVIRAQTAAQNLKLPLQKDFDELSVLLIAQKPDVLEKILQLADKIEPPAKFAASEMGARTSEAATALVPPGAAAATPPGPAAAPTPAAAAATPAAAAATPAHPQASAAATAVPAPGPAALAAPAAAAAAMPPRNAQPDVTIEQSRASLLAAKELLIVGTEPSQIIPKIAHAQVLLEEGGHAEFAEQFGAAIKALRAHDEQKARTALDSVLGSLRSL